MNEIVRVNLQGGSLKAAGLGDGSLWDKTIPKLRLRLPPEHLQCAMENHC